MILRTAGRDQLAVGVQMGLEAWCSADTNADSALGSELCPTVVITGQKVLWLSESHSVQVYNSRRRLLKLLIHVISTYRFLFETNT